LISLLALVFDPVKGDDSFCRDTKFSPNYTASQPSHIHGLGRSSNRSHNIYAPCSAETCFTRSYRTAVGTRVATTFMRLAVLKPASHTATELS
jgi:hypothetical protein